MVLAEIPLWVTHSNHSSETETTTTGAATTSWSLWSRAHKDRAAIYATDVHPTLPLFATAGGDGRVRLWHTETLFTNAGQAATHQGGRFVAAPAGDDDDKKTTSTTYVSTSASSSNGGSSGEDEDDGMLSAPETTTNGSRQPAPVVHDLSNVVRSRKHPEAASPERLHHTALAGASTLDNEASLVSTLPSATDPPQRLLCTLSAHTGSSVLCVRFSSTGKWLASAGDDGCVCIYAPTTTNSTTTTTWHRILLCRGHDLDVVGLAWSPDDSYLVSCSLDRETPVIVWKPGAHAHTAGMIQSPYKVLGRLEHSSTVKGVCFDPVGSYLATSGDDPAILIWRTHGDWGLEHKIDAGIFRPADNRSLSAQSLFRRLSWSTDGAHVCATNGVVKNKHVASTISRQGWATASQGGAAGAANLVGHKQPVVASRHAPRLLAIGGSNSSSSDPDEEPSYATLLALGDKKGFVTIWSTRKSRPLFKLQCSESRCTVTDLAWGILPDGESLFLLVALLDGQLVALRFGADEIGALLSNPDQSKLFRLRYGLDTDDPTSSYGRILDEGPRLVETALQMTLEDEHGDEDDEEDQEPPKAASTLQAVNQLMGRSKKNAGKKRVQPLLMTQPLPPPVVKRAKTAKPVPAVADPLGHAKQIAEKAAAVANAAEIATPARVGTSPTTLPPRTSVAPPLVRTATFAATSLTYSTEAIHSIDLPAEAGLLMEGQVRWTVECQNRPHQVPLGAKGPALPCLDIALCRDGQAVWRDQVVGTSCSCLAGNSRMFAVGMADGTLLLYGAASTNGWNAETAVRAFPPIIVGHSVVTLHTQDVDGVASLLVVAADGSFGVYKLEPSLAKIFGGSILPALTHMSHTNTEGRLPKMSRCQLTSNGQVLLLLSLSASNSATSSTDARSGDTTGTAIGGSIQGFVYNRDLELWLRVSDSRFVMSDFYSSLPLRGSHDKSIMRDLDDSVRLGAMEATLRAAQRKRTDPTSASLYSNSTAGNTFVPTRAHCEDRLACALILRSELDYKHWLGLYAKTLAAGGHEASLRTLIDALLQAEESHWCLSAGLNSLGLDRKGLLKSVVLPAMSRNRALQRLTNELAAELEA
jgi:protein HIRA/HIR1